MIKLSREVGGQRMALWDQVGYSTNPYTVNPLAPNAEGSELIVGRDKELRRLMTQLRSTDTHPTIEGDNGSGKTSLVAVAAYRAEREYIEKKEDQLLIPISDIIQMTAGVGEFERSAYFAVAKAYLRNVEKLTEWGFVTVDTSELEKWIGAPFIYGGGAGASVAGVGGSVSRTAAANTGQGFTDAGFRQLVKDCLGTTFPTREHGAFVGVIDNIELLRTSADARQALEAVRDTVLSLPGVRWVLCGAKGIVRSVVSSPRLSGRIGRPIDLKPVPDEEVPELVRRRLARYSTRPDPDAPVDPDGFAHLYKISNANLRNSFKHAQDFAVWLDEEDKLSEPPSQKRALLEEWIDVTAAEHSAAAPLQQGQWSLFDKITDAGGTMAPGDFEAFGFNTQQAMRFHLQRLEEANLIDSVIDEEDQRRKTISVTSNGWLVAYHRAKLRA
ncbi:AAA family ATPase [Streptomyces sp. NPDC101221]|uniref:AAA family ATPase n=1 Tax=Streptomyces sp. NPDC101221 TaxID=3366132 RepID=UPI003811EC7F